MTGTLTIDAATEKNGGASAIRPRYWKLVRRRLFTDHGGAMPCTRIDKVSYATAGEARGAVRAIKSKGDCPALRVYACSDHFPITRQIAESAKWTPPKATSAKG